MRFLKYIALDVIISILKVANHYDYDALTSKPDQDKNIIYEAMVDCLK